MSNTKFTCVSDCPYFVYYLYDENLLISLSSGNSLAVGGMMFLTCMTFVKFVTMQSMMSPDGEKTLGYALFQKAGRAEKKFASQA